MAEETEQTSEEGTEEKVVQFDPKNNRAIFWVLIVDMAEDIRDVVGMLHICAADPQQAVRKAFTIFKEQGVIKDGGTYHVQMGALAPLPNAGPQIVRPNVILPKDLTRHG